MRIVPGRVKSLRQPKYVDPSADNCLGNNEATVSTPLVLGWCTLSEIGNYSFNIRSTNYYKNAHKVCFIIHVSLFLVLY